MSCRTVSSGLPHKISNNILSQAGGNFCLFLELGGRKKKKSLKRSPPSAVVFREANLCTGDWRENLRFQWSRQSNNPSIFCLTRSTQRRLNQIYGEERSYCRRKWEQQGTGQNMKEGKGVWEKKGFLKESRKNLLYSLSFVFFSLSSSHFFLSKLLFLP